MPPTVTGLINLVGRLWTILARKSPCFGLNLALMFVSRCELRSNWWTFERKNRLRVYVVFSPGFLNVLPGCRCFRVTIVQRMYLRLKSYCCIVTTFPLYIIREFYAGMSDVTAGVSRTMLVSAEYFPYTHLLHDHDLLRACRHSFHFAVMEATEQTAMATAGTPSVLKYASTQQLIGSAYCMGSHR